MSLFDTLYANLPGHPCAWSPCKRYRYTLWRVWAAEPKRICMVIGLNPSTADEIENDPTIRRCISFAQREGCDALVMTNIFAFRATDPNDMKAEPEPVGTENNDWLIRCSSLAAIRIAAWGVHGEFRGRAGEVANLVPDLLCLGTTSEGHPRHPLYVRGDTPLATWNAKEKAH